MATIYAVQNQISVTAAGNPATVVFPNPPNPGNLLIATANETTTASGAVSIPNFSLIQNLQVANVATSWGYVLTSTAAAGQTASIVMTDSGTPTVTQFEILEFQGATSTQDVTAVTVNSGATTATSLATPLSITTTSANTVLITGIYFSGTSTVGSTVADSSFVNVPNNNRMATAYKIVSAAGTYTVNWTWASSVKYSAFLMAFKMQASPPNPTAFFNT